VKYETCAVIVDAWCETVCRSLVDVEKVLSRLALLPRDPGVRLSRGRFPPAELSSLFLALFQS